MLGTHKGQACDAKDGECVVMSISNPTDECLARVLRELQTTEAQVKDDVRVIKAWLNQQPHLPNIQGQSKVFLCTCYVHEVFTL